MTFKIARKYLVGLANWLNSLSLAGPQSRARTRFIILAQEALDRADKERLAVVDEYAEKEEDGSLKKTIDEKTEKESFVIPDDKLAEFTKEVNDIFEVEAEMSGPEFAMNLITLRNLVLNTEEKISPALAMQYDEWCNAFEKLELK